MIEKGIAPAYYWLQNGFLPPAIAPPHMEWAWGLLYQGHHRNWKILSNFKQKVYIKTKS
jgi:hypothetical protein